MNVSGSNEEMKMAIESGRSGAIECWRPCHGYEGFYEVSNLGRIRAAETGRVLSTAGTDKDGYPVVSLTRWKVRQTHALHRLIALSFHGDRCNVLHNQVAHLDGDRKNARADNLKWVSKIENEAHRIGHGTHSRGDRNGAAKLTNEQAREIRTAPRRRGNRPILAEKYGVSVHTISNIWREKRYARI
jgi:hypothetical protein